MHLIGVDLHISELPIVESVDAAKTILKRTGELFAVQSLIAPVLTCEPVIDAGVELLLLYVRVKGFRRGGHRHHHRRF